MSTTEEKIGAFFNVGVGKPVRDVLRDGASIEITIDGKPYTLKKEMGEIKVKPGKRTGQIVQLQYDKEAMDDILNSKDFWDFNLRMAKLRVDRKARMRILRKDRRSLQEYFWRGLHEGIRRMGFHI